MNKEPKSRNTMLFPKHAECNKKNILLSAVSRLTTQTWCIENSFELVELSPLNDEEDDDIGKNILKSKI